MLKWMQSFGEVKRIGVECTGTYGAGLPRYLQRFGIEILEVTSPDKTNRRKRGKDDTLDAENAAHAAFAGIRTVTPKTRDDIVESLRVLKFMQENRHCSSSYRTTNDPDEYYLCTRGYS